MSVRAGSTHLDLCGWSLGTTVGFQSSPGKSNEWLESRSTGTNAVQWFSNQCALKPQVGGMGAGGMLGKTHCRVHPQSFCFGGNET